MVIEFGTLKVDRERYEVMVAGGVVQLTYQEFNALWFIAALEGRVATYEALARELWGEPDARSARRLTVLMSRLRAKLGNEGAALVETVTRVGYRMSEAQGAR